MTKKEAIRIVRDMVEQDRGRGVHTDVSGWRVAAAAAGDLRTVEAIDVLGILVAQHVAEEEEEEL